MNININLDNVNDNKDVIEKDISADDLFLKNNKSKCLDLLNKINKEIDKNLNKEINDKKVINTIYGSNNIDKDIEDYELLEKDRLKREKNYLEQTKIDKIREKYNKPYLPQSKQNSEDNKIKRNIFNNLKNYKGTIDLSRNSNQDKQRDRPIGLNYKIPYAKNTLETKPLTFRERMENRLETKPLTFRERMENRLKQIGVYNNDKYSDIYNSQYDSYYDEQNEDPKIFVRLVDKNFDESLNKNDKYSDLKRPTLKLLIDKLKNKYINRTKYDRDEIEFYETLNEDKRNKVDKIEHKISKINNIKIPIRFRVLSSRLTLKQKSTIINKLENLTSNKMFGSSEITKYSNWVTSLLKIPFKIYKELPINVESSEKEVGDYLINVKNTLDSAVYGHEKTKEQILQVLAQWISNPSSVGNFIAIQGPAGNGKTTLVKNGISKAIDRPFAFISLGGATDAAFLDGHSFTYEGSLYGKIADILMNCGCMNPVFYFDELDKISQTPKGEEIANLLIHLTDSSQNDQFNDKYFNGIPFDLSKALFIFSYNNIENVNPILLDRLINIKTKGFELEDKLKIAEKYLIPDICEMLSMKQENILLDEDTIKFIIKEYTGEEGGVRSLKKILYNILSRINLLNLTKHNKDIKYTFDTEITKENDKLIINENTLKKLINENNEDETINESISHMYM